MTVGFGRALVRGVVAGAAGPDSSVRVGGTLTHRAVDHLVKGLGQLRRQLGVDDGPRRLVGHHETQQVVARDVQRLEGLLVHELHPLGLRLLVVDVEVEGPEGDLADDERGHDDGHELGHLLLPVGVAVLEVALADEVGQEVEAQDEQHGNEAGEGVDQPDVPLNVRALRVAAVAVVVLHVQQEGRGRQKGDNPQHHRARHRLPRAGGVVSPAGQQDGAQYGQNDQVVSRYKTRAHL